MFATLTDERLIVGLLDFFLDGAKREDGASQSQPSLVSGRAPAASMGGEVFYQAAQRAGLPTDINTLNRIVQGVNSGMTPDDAARAAAGGKPKPRGLLGGLLDSDEGRIGLGLLAAAGPSDRPMSLGQRLAGGLLQADEWKQRQQRSMDADLMRSMQMDELLNKQTMRQRRQQFIASIPSPRMQAVQTSMAANGGPTNAAAAALPPSDQNAELLHGAMQAGFIDPMQYLASVKKDRTPMITKAGDVARDPVTGQELWRNEDKAHTPADWQLFQLSGAPQRGMTFDQWDMNRRQASRPSVSVDMRGDNAYAAAQ